MQFTNLANKATNKLKDGAGYVQGVLVVAPGSAWTLQVFDSNDSGTPAHPILGATAMTVPAAGTFLDLDCHFSNGLIVVTAGTTAGEIVVTWY
jgi:hypothetical protein